MMSAVASKAVKQAIIEACGRNYGAGLSGRGPSVKIQTRLYNRMTALFAKHNLSESDIERAHILGRSWWDNKAMKGSGVDW